MQINGYAVALLGAQALTRFIEGKALFVIIFYDVLQLVAGEGVAVGGAGGQQVGHGYPAARLQREADGCGLVAQVLAEKLAEAGGGFGIHAANVARTLRVRSLSGLPLRGLAESALRPDRYCHAA